jgi:5'-nucleotidase
MIFRLVGAALLLSLGACASIGQLNPFAGRPQASTVRLIAFNDFHGNLDPPAGAIAAPDPVHPGQNVPLSAGGAAYLATLVKRLQAGNPLNAVVAAGDLVSASPLDSALFHDEPSIEVLNALGLEYSSVGNHEFDHGREELLRLQNGGCLATGERGKDTCVNGGFAGARFRYLAANVRDRSSGKTLFPPYAIKTLEAGHGVQLKLAFIGLVLRDTPAMVRPEGVAGLEFSDEAASANALLPELRAQNVDAIVVLIHQGGATDGSYNDKTCPGLRGDILPIVDALDPAIRVVVSAHTHRAYVCERAGKLLTSAGSYGRYLTELELRIDPAAHRVLNAGADNLAVINDLAGSPDAAIYPPLEQDGAVAALVARYDALAAPLAERVVGRISADLTRETNAAGESALGDLVADIMLSATGPRAQGGAAIAFTNAGGLRQDLQFSRHAKGAVTYNDLYTVLPFGNALVTLDLTGAQIKAVLEQQSFDDPQKRFLQVSRGFSYAWSTLAPAGSHVDPRSLRLNGRPIDPGRSYRVTVNEFIAQGGDGFTVFAQGQGRQIGRRELDAALDYLKSHSPIAPRKADRIVRK